MKSFMLRFSRSSLRLEDFDLEGTDASTILLKMHFGFKAVKELNHGFAP
jgi:hypothetical protein